MKAVCLLNGPGTVNQDRSAPSGPACHHHDSGNAMAGWEAPVCVRAAARTGRRSAERLSATDRRSVRPPDEFAPTRRARGIERPEAAAVPLWQQITKLPDEPC